MRNATQQPPANSSRPKHPCSIGTYVAGSSTAQPPYSPSESMRRLPMMPNAPRNASALRDWMLGSCATRPWYEWRWKPSQPKACGARRIDTASADTSTFCKAFGRRRLLFVGDSLQGQQFFSMAALLGTTDAHKYCAAGYVDNEPLPVCGGAGAIGFMRSDHLIERRDGKRCPTGVCQLNWTRAAQAYDTFVINRGAHMVPDAELAAHLSAMARTLRPLPHTLVWRMSVPGHEGCTTADRPLPSRFTPPSGSAYGWDQFERQNELAYRVLESVAPGRFLYLDADELSNTRADRHVGTKVKRAVPLYTGVGYAGLAPTAIDCLHYCLPGPPDEWNAFLLFVLLRAPPRSGSRPSGE